MLLRRREPSLASRRREKEEGNDARRPHSTSNGTSDRRSNPRPEGEERNHERNVLMRHRSLRRNLCSDDRHGSAEASQNLGHDESGSVVHSVLVDEEAVSCGRIVSGFRELRKKGRQTNDLDSDSADLDSLKSSGG
jgi:hypothetical protein